MLTFEKIRDLERAEKDSKKLQKLPDDFLEELREYLKKKESMKDKTTSDILEIENVKNTIKRLVEMREKKILDSVLLAVRSNMMPENLSKSEEAFFSQTVERLKFHRDRFFDELKNGKKSTVQENPREVLYKVKKTLPHFVGPDMNIYNLEENQILAIPKPLSDLLLKEGVIEEIQDS